MTQPATLGDYFDELRTLVETGLEHAVHTSGAPPVLADGLAYALLGGGKRLRPCLTLAVADSVADHLNLETEEARWLALPSACAVEMVHSYSLVHDDLPSMDDDELRRGRPTTHIVFGEGLAVLAGDGLLTDAFGVIARSPSPVLPLGAPEAPPERRLHAIAMLASAAGAAGMVGGQAIDLAAAGQVTGYVAGGLDSAGLIDMHARKTGALIRAAATLGAVAVGAPDGLVVQIDAYARELGLAFQIVDDILDVEGSAETLGKTAGKDSAADKPTYPSIYGIEESSRLARACVDRARAALESAGLTGWLEDIAEWTLARRH
ncbi:MAG: polyprenyl synthetase family protein [Vicinamibacterales bacterium]